MLTILAAMLFSGLTVTGPRQDEVWETYWQLPRIRSTVPVAIIPFKDWKHGDQTLGVYYIVRGQVEVRDDLDKDTFSVCVAHEYAHAVWHVGLQKALREKWSSEVWVPMASLAARPYCWSSPSECFAECFATRFVGTKSYLYTKPLDPAIAKKVDEFVAAYRADPLDKKDSFGLPDIITCTWESRPAGNGKSGLMD